MNERKKPLSLGHWMQEEAQRDEQLPKHYITSWDAKMKKPLKITITIRSRCLQSMFNNFEKWNISKRRVIIHALRKLYFSDSYLKTAKVFKEKGWEEALRV